MKPVRFYHFNAHGKVISVAAASREEAEGKVRRHLTRRGKSHQFSPTTAGGSNPHPSADHVLKEDMEDLEELSQEKLNKYADKATNDRSKHFANPRKYYNRMDGVSAAVKKALEKRDDIVKEESNEIDEALDIQQRQKRAMVMRRNRPKIDRARKLAQRRMASNDNIKNRAYKKARDLVRKRVAGKQGAQYHDLGPTQKIIIDKQVEKKKKLIKKLALRLIPRVKQAEQQRLQSFFKGQSLSNQGAPEGKKVNESINSMFAEEFPVVATRSKNEKSNVKLVDDQASKKSAKGDELAGNKNIVMFSKFSDAAQTESAEFRALVKKSERSGIDLEVLGEVFDRGYNSWNEELDVTAEQHAFARVNSFINQGKSFFEEDADLQEVSGKTLSKYIQHAVSDFTMSSTGARNANPNEQPYFKDRVAKRRAGIATAINKMDAAHGVDPEKPVKVPAKLKEDADLQEVSSSRLNSAAFRSAQKNAAELRAQSGGKPAPTRNLAQKTDKSWKSFSRELEKTHKEKAKHHHARYLHHKAAYNEASDTYHGIETDHKNYGYASKEEAHGGLEELQGMMDHHAEKMNHHYDQANHHNYMLDKPLKLKEDADLSEARPVDNKDYDDSEKAWDKRKKDFEKNFDKDGKPKKDLKEASREEIDAYVNKAQETTKRYQDMWVTHSKGSGIVTAHDPKKKNHVIVTATGGQDHSEHSVHIKDLRKWNSKTATHVPVHSKEELKKLTEDLEEGTMQPYVKPHTNDKGEHIGWKSCNKYGKTKYWQKFAKASAHKHAGIELKEEVDKNSRQRMKVKTVERDDDNEPTDIKSVHNKHQQLTKKIIEQQIDPKKREVGTDELVKAYKDDTPGQSLKEFMAVPKRSDDKQEKRNSRLRDLISAKRHPHKDKNKQKKYEDAAKKELEKLGEEEIKETAYSSDKKPVVVPAHYDAHGNQIPAKTVLRRSRRMIVNPDDNPNDGK